jgi:hypothetical protein
MLGQLLEPADPGGRPVRLSYRPGPASFSSCVPFASLAAARAAHRLAGGSSFENDAGLASDQRGQGIGHEPLEQTGQSGPQKYE